MPTITSLLVECYNIVMAFWLGLSQDMLRRDLEVPGSFLLQPSDIYLDFGIV